MPKEFETKRVLVTGAASGIGQHKQLPLLSKVLKLLAST